MTPCIFTIAMTVSGRQKSDNPAVPITVSEQVESTHEAFEAGATLVKRVVALCDTHAKRAATLSGTRDLLGLAPA